MIGLVLFLVPLIPVKGETSCRPVDGDRITMGDLAAADRRFSGMDAVKAIGSTPEPGAKRVFWASELLRLAHGTEDTDGGPFHPVCFERRTRLLNAEEFVAAIRAWAPGTAQISVVEQSRFPAPVGELTIPKPAVARAAADGSFLLRGYVRFGAGRRFPVWARVRVNVKQTLVVPSQEIAAGVEVRPEQLRVEERDAGWETAQFASGMEQVAGKVTRKHLAAGAPVLMTSLEVPKEVTMGSIVKVEVRDGAARLAFDGRAETGGRTGEMVTVRNPSSGKAFQARVTGEAAVLVVPRHPHFEETEK